MKKRVLGLDLGPNSVGWAVVDYLDDGTATFVKMGVRVFPEGVDNFDTAKEVSRTEARRVARGMRRQIQRRKQRVVTLRRALAECGLLPTDPSEQDEWCKRDPYELRTKAIQVRLEPFEIGRVFLHLAKRRGFLSNRKKDRKDGEVKGMLAEINALEAERQASDAPTLGAMLYQKIQNQSHRRRAENDHIRNRHTARAQYEAEFDAIWSAQRSFGHEQLLTDTLKYGTAGRGKYPCIPRRRPHGKSPLASYGIYGLIYFQRKMYWPRSRVGICALEPRQRRCPIADRHAQQFRLFQEINNLRYVDPRTNTEDRLSPTQRDALLRALSTVESLTFDQIRKLLGFSDALRFNLERGKRPKLQGHETDTLVAKALGKQWHQSPEAQKDKLVRAILDPDLDEAEFRQFVVTELGLSDAELQRALTIDLREGYSHLSLKAIDRLLPFLAQGLVYQADSDPERSALHAAGYLRRDELQRRLFDSLPNPDRLKNSPLGDIPNPVVKRAFTELRKVVNAIMREFQGDERISEIHVEMGRDVKTRPKRGTKAFDKYMERLDEMREREADREQAMTKLRENDIRPTRENVLKYLLWQQQGECVYSGNPITFTQLFGQDIEIDHILPRSRSLDDSQMNKVLCFRHTPNELGNHDKGDRTPYEWLAAQRPSEFEAMCQRAKKLPYPKYRRFLLKELKLDDFIQRQLNDTRYLAKLAGEYLKCLVPNDHDVLGLKGQLTAELRHIWGLDTVLADLPDSPAWHEEAKLSVGEKNRADHRHHAIDALIIALTDRRRLADLSKLFRGWDAHEREPDLEEPWPDFRKSVVSAASEIKVSRRCERKVSGGLHEDTIYGKTNVPGEWVVRKPLESLSPNEIGRIRDATIRWIVVARLKQHGIEFGRKTKPDAKKWKEALHDVYMPSGVPIKKVRVTRPELTIQAIRSGTANECYVKPGSTHHICIFEWMEGKKARREAIFVTMLEVANRVKTGQPIVRRVHPEKSDATFVMSLSRGEYVLAQCDGEERLLYFRTAASTQGQLYFAEHTDARKSDESRKFVFKANTLKARKVTVDPLGRIRWAND